MLDHGEVAWSPSNLQDGSWWYWRVRATREFHIPDELKRLYGPWSEASYFYTDFKGGKPPRAGPDLQKLGKLKSGEVTTSRDRGGSQTAWELPAAPQLLWPPSGVVLEGEEAMNPNLRASLSLAPADSVEFYVEIDRLPTFDGAFLQRSSDTPLMYEVLWNDVKYTGDRKDNDGDGFIDEEVVNGKDDDGDGLTDEDIHHPLDGKKWKIILIGTTFGLVAYFVLAAFGMPIFLIWGYVQSVNGIPHALLPQIIGALLARFYFWQRYGKQQWRRYAMVLSVGFGVGMALIGMLCAALAMIQQGCLYAHLLKALIVSRLRDIPSEYRDYLAKRIRPTLGQEGATLRWRGFWVGSFLSVFLAVGAPYGNMVVHSTYMSSDFSTPGAIFLFLALIGVFNLVWKLTGRHPVAAAAFAAAMTSAWLYAHWPFDNLQLHNPGLIFSTPLVISSLANAVLSARRQSLALNRAELILVYAMLMTVSALCTFGLSEQLPGTISAIFYYATPQNEWAEKLIPHLPRRSTVNDGADNTLFYEGAASPDIPYGAWVEPLLWWGVFLLALYVAMVSIAVILRRQWMERERLAYPAAQVGLAMIRGEDSERLVNGFFKRPSMWIGWSIPVIISGMRGMSRFGVNLPGCRRPGTSRPSTSCRCSCRSISSPSDSRTSSTLR